MKVQTTQRHILVTGDEYQLPYSKGLMASRIMATGLAPARAFHVAEVVEDRIHALDRSSISRTELDDVTLKVLADEVGERYATSYAKWQMVTRLPIPLVVLLGGATGVGKSTIATMLAARLGITRVIPTDAIREVMRSMFTEDLMPALHTSSFDAARLVRKPMPEGADPVILGFREQASAVAVGIQALISRAVAEGTDLIVEGAHVVPAFVDNAQYAGKAVLLPVVVTVDDEELHRSHFVMRSHESRNRPSERYLDHFENIRKIQNYVKSLANEHDVDVVPSYNLDATLSQVIDLVVNQAIQAVPVPVPDSVRPSKRGTE
ncbi:MAG: AAA family ATPase [Actinobacteria bacterium]|nr:AAA family ATPase [Actinomycetota bacterium]